MAQILQALRLKLQIADAQHLIDEQHVRIQMGGDRKTKTRVHSRTVSLDWRVDEGFDSREVHYLFESALNVRTPHPQNGTLKIDVLAAGEIRMESRGDLDERPDSSPDEAPTLCRLQDSSQKLQSGRLSGAVGTDDPKRLAGFHLERHIAHCPELLIVQVTELFATQSFPDHCRDEIAQGVVTLTTPKLLPDAVECDRCQAHLHILRELKLSAMKRNPTHGQNDER